MSGEANAEAFSGSALKSNYDAACGLGTYGGNTIRNGGIVMPDKSRLMPGTYLYRFGSMGKADTVERNGRWWILDTTFDLYASIAGSAESLERMARQNLAVANEFSTMDKLIKASVSRPLLVFSGVGAGFFEPGASGKVVLLGGMELNGSSLDQARKYQFCIPGLAQCSPPALTVEWVMPVEDWFRKGKPR